MKIDEQVKWLLVVIVAAAISFVANYLMALSGEPRSLWLMNVVFGMEL